MKKTLVALTLAATAMLAGCSKKHSFTTLSKGSDGGIPNGASREKHNSIIDYYVTEDEWPIVWKVIHLHNNSELPVPEVDFDKYTVILICKAKSTSGYSIDITDIIEDRFHIRVYAQETKPAQDQEVMQVFTYPYHLVKTDKMPRKQLVTHYE